MEGVSYGQGPVPDRDTPADRSVHQGAGGRTRGERELALQAPPPLPPRGSRRARAAVSAAQDLARAGSPTSTRTRSCASERSWPSPASMPGPRPSTSTWRPRGARCRRVSTIYRVLVARGFVVPEPHKRPKSSWTRFEADFPNECWQADVTHVEVAEGWRLRGPQHHRRPLEAVRGLAGLRHHARARRGAHLAQSGWRSGAIRSAS